MEGKALICVAAAGASLAEDFERREEAADGGAGTLMSKWSIDAWCLLIVLTMCGCGHERLPNDVLPPLNEARTSDSLPGTDGHEMTVGRTRLQPRLVREARPVLEAIFTGEQTYFQRLGTYVDVPAGGDFEGILGVYVGGQVADVLERWEFSVTDASLMGFRAHAEGRSGSIAEGIVITLTHRRSEVPVWTIWWKPLGDGPIHPGRRVAGSPANAAGVSGTRARLQAVDR